MRVQYTISDATARATAGRAQSLGLHPGRLVEYVMTQWLLKNEAVTLTSGSPVSAPVVSASSARAPFCLKCGTEDNGTNFKGGVHQGCPVPPPPAPKRGPSKVDMMTYRVPICTECAKELTPGEIGPGDTHTDCPGMNAGALGLE